MICPTHKSAMAPLKTQYGLRWTCTTKGCSVACWEGHTSTPADKETRQERIKTHYLFDSLWKDPKGPFRWINSGSKKRYRKQKRRNAAYSWLQSQMNVPPGDCHIGMFDMDQLKQVQNAIAMEFAAK